MEEETLMRDRLAEAIQLRETGRAMQDQAMLEEARTLLLELVAAYPDEAEITGVNPLTGQETIMMGQVNKVVMVETSVQRAIDLGKQLTSFPQTSLSW
jgi:hypothetical protein